MTVVISMPYPAVMAEKNENETKDPAADRRRSPARARMVQSAAALIRERGIHGTGLREVVATPAVRAARSAASSPAARHSS